MLKDISNSKSEHVFDMQISNYENDGMKYLVLSSATKDPFRDNQYRSISVGLLINKQLQRKLNFLNDPKIKSKNVGVTCERCAIMDCEVREVAPVFLNKKAKNEKLESIVQALNAKFS